MNTISTTFAWNLDTETERLLHDSSQLANDFYRSKNFKVIPFLKPRDMSTIYFLDLPYYKIENYWEKVRLLKPNFPIQCDGDVILEAKELLRPYLRTDFNKLETLKNEWIKIEKEFWEILATLIPTYKEVINEVDIRMTGFGSMSSFSDLEKGKCIKHICYIREDADASHIASAIISSLVLLEKGETLFSWEQTEGVVDYLLTQSALGELLPEYIPTLQPLQGNHLDLDTISENYIKKLGLVFEKQFVLNDSKIFFRNTCIDTTLTKMQAKILSLMVNLENEIVSTDEIANVIWEDNNDFSLWAVNKTMQRLRNTLIELGASPFCIKAVRGRGYILIN